METIQGVRIVGGNLALDFVNTRTGPPGAPPDLDILHTYADLVDWAQYADALPVRQANSLRRVATERPREASRRFREALELRDRLDQIFQRLSGGQKVQAQDLNALRDAYAEALRHADLVHDGTFEWSWTDGTDLGRPTWPIVHAAVGLLTTGPLDRVKACAGCQFIFLDETKNRSRRWCSMLDCGSAEKVRKYVRRRAERRQRA